MILQIEQCRVGEGGWRNGERGEGTGHGVGRRGQRNTRSASTMHCARENQHSRWWRWQRGGNILLGTDFQDFQRPEKKEEEEKKDEKKEGIILRPEADERGRDEEDGEGVENSEGDYLVRERVKRHAVMLYRYVVGVRYVICNIIIDVSYELFVDAELGKRSEGRAGAREMEAELSARESWNV